MKYQVSETIRASVAALMAHPAVRAAWQAAEEDQTECIRQQCELVCIEAPTFQEETRAVRYAELMREAGLTDVQIDRGGNVIGVRRGRGEGPTVLVEAHLDTVFPMGSVHGVTEKDGMLFAPGISDNTRGLAMLLSLARALNAADVQTAGDVVFLATTQEEGAGDMQGIKAFLQDGHRIDAALCIDYGHIRQIIWEATGVKTIEVTFHGIGGHSWAAFGEVANPLHAAARAIAKIADFDVPSVPRTSYCVSNFHAGNTAGIHAIVPEATIKINYRSNDRAVHDDLERRILAAIQEACDEESARWSRDSITWDMKRVVDIPAATQDQHAPILEGFHALLEHMGEEPIFLRGGATNASICIGAGIPALCMGSHWAARGEIINTMDHTLQERFPVEGAYRGVQALLAAALLCTGVVGPDGSTKSIL